MFPRGFGESAALGQESETYVHVVLLRNISQRASRAGPGQVSMQTISPSACLWPE